MIKRFNLIFDELEEVADTEGLVLPVERTYRFRETCLKLAKQLEQINTVTVALQKHSITLNESRFLIDTLIETIEKQKMLPGAPLYKCKLKYDHITLNSCHSPDSIFESGVIKIQNGDIDSLTPDEKSSCANLKVTNGRAISTTESQSNLESMDLANILKNRKRRKVEKNGMYMNLDFILGSAAQIERLFSIARLLCPENRQ